ARNDTRVRSSPVTPDCRRTLSQFPTSPSDGAAATQVLEGACAFSTRGAVHAARSTVRDAKAIQTGVWRVNACIDQLLILYRQSYFVLDFPQPDDGAGLSQPGQVEQEAV